MPKYSYKKNNSYESSESSGSSVGSDQDKFEMDQYGNPINMYHPDMNRSREEQRTYMNPILNVPSYAPDRYGYRQTPPQHIYHPIVVPQGPVYPSYDYNMYQSNYYSPHHHNNQHYNYNRGPGGGRGGPSPYRHQNFNRSPYYNRRPYHNHQRPNHVPNFQNHPQNYQNSYHRNHGPSYEPPLIQEPPRSLMEIEIPQFSPQKFKGCENSSPDVYSDSSSAISDQNSKFHLYLDVSAENSGINETMESSVATFDSSENNGTLETSEMQSTTMESSVLESSCANQTLDVTGVSEKLENSAMEQSYSVVNQSIEHPPVYETFQVPILGSWVNQANQSETDNSLANQSLEVQVPDDFNKTDQSMADVSSVRPENESCETADDSGVRPENESSEMMDESEIVPEHESSGIVGDVGPTKSCSGQEMPEIEKKNSEIRYQLEDSCNAVDHNISRSVSNDFISDLSFNGKINSLSNQGKSSSSENTRNIENFQSKLEEAEKTIEEPVKSTEEKAEEETEEEKLRNESFEALKKEDSSMMVYLNEKSPDLFDASDLALQDEEEEEEASDSEPVKETEEQTKISDTSLRQKSADCDKKILGKLRNTLSGICPPPSVTRLKFTMEQMLAMYKENESKPADPVGDFRTEERESFFKPSVNGEEILEMEWPDNFYVKCHDVFYNRNNNCEVIEKLLLKFGERYVGYETTSSLNAAKSPSSARKRTEKFKLLSQSPGSRLSHLAKRRTIFSSANLRSKLLNTSQASVKAAPTSSRQILVDKRKLPLMQKTLKPSPRRKTPGKRRKTPKSTKKSAHKSASKSSKRALFTSPAHPKESKPNAVAGPSRLQSFKRALFSPLNSKRKRSDSIESNESLNAGNLAKPTKLARIENSPNKLMKSYSFSVAGTAGIESSSSLMRRGAIMRTHSEQLMSCNVSFRQPLTEEHKRKLLWAASSALNNKQISKDHEKFKEYATLLVRLTKRIFIEFYDPLVKSMSTQMLKFANSMVFYVIQGRSYDDIYTLTKDKLQKTKGVSRVSTYIAQEELERNRNLVRRSSSQLFQSNSSLNISNFSSSENLTTFNVASRKSSISENSSSATKSDRSTSKNNDGVGALRENLLRNISDQKNSAHRASESDLKMLTNEIAVQQVHLKLKDLQGLIHDIEDERRRNENTIQCIYRNQKSNPSKLRSLYKFAANEALKEEKLIREALKKITEIREIRNERRMQAKNAGNKVTLRQGELMKLVLSLAKTLPLFVSQPGEKVPPLCGCIPADSSYSPKTGDLVAAMVKLGTENTGYDWILAEVVQHHHNLGKTEVIDVDSEIKSTKKHKHMLSRRHIIPLPQFRANPSTDPNALYKKDTPIMALYPQTTTFYAGIVHQPPENSADDYQILFEDSTCESGYSKPLRVPQRYVFSMKQSKKSLYS